MEKWAGKIAFWFKNQLQLDEEKTEVVAYSVTSLFLLFTNLCFIFIVCRLLGIVKEGFTAAFTAAALRSVTGGAHLSSSRRCTILSCVLPASFGYLGKHAGPLLSLKISAGILLLNLVWALYVVAQYAPAEVKARPIRPEKRGFYRKAGMVATLCWAVLAGYFLCAGYPALFVAGSCGFLWQTITLTPLGFTIYYRLSGKK